MAFCKRLFLCLVSCLILSAALTHSGAHAQAQTTQVHTDVHEIVIGSLLDQSGPRMMQDRMVEAALRVGVEEINEHFAQIDFPVRFTLRFGDTRTDPDHALLQLQAMAQDGVGIVIGPASSEELFRVRPYAQTQGILIISPSSTAPSLAIPGDLVYRMVPDDTRQGKILADRMWKDGIRAVVPIRRDDLYSQDLTHYTRQAFESRDLMINFGGDDSDHDGPVAGTNCRLPESELPVQVCGGVVYNPRTVDFLSEVQSLSDAVSEAVRAYGARRVAVLLIGFDESVSIFMQAAHSPILSLVRWYGTDGTAKSNSIASQPDAARFAVDASFTASIFAEPQTDRFAKLSDAVMQRSGVDADANAAVAYDALWLVARAIEAEGAGANPRLLGQVLSKAAEGYVGASGPVRFNDAGDRDSDDFDFWRLQRRGSTYEWVRAR